MPDLRLGARCVNRGLGGPEVPRRDRRALDWLNERTDLGISFFGVEVGVVQIGDDGLRAPVFEVVARPNDLHKSVKVGSSTASSNISVATPLNAQRQEFYAGILSEFTATRPSVRMPARTTGERRASRIAAYHDVSLDDDSARPAARAWGINALSQMYAALNEPLRTRAKALRSAFSAGSDAIDLPARTEDGPSAYVERPVVPGV